ncbi:MAG: Flp pilus assembly protein CpaB, partial [Acidobacteria bacterium]|nr:Flp pilus assembly protein CpaB [Acidobacteriota bacterium]
MNRKVLIVGGIALAAATAATLFFYTVLADRMGGGEKAVATARLVVAAHSLPRGVKIAKDDLEVETRPAAEVPPGAFTSPEQLEGLYLAQEVMAGRPITSASLPANGNGGVSAVVPPGMRAV